MVAQKVLQHFLYFSQNKQEMYAVFLWLILNVLLATAVPWNMFCNACPGFLKMVWYDVRFKQQAVK
jgi:hypothetical protein